MSKIMALLTPPSRTHRTAEENLGLGYIASILRNAGYIVHIVDSWIEGVSVQKLIERLLLIDKIDFIGISCYRSSLDEVKKIVLEIRSKIGKVPIIAGGFGPTFYPEDFLDIGVDIAVIGEGEYIIVNLLKILEEGSSLESIPGISWKEGKKIKFGAKPIAFPKIDSLPFPERDTVKFSIERKNPIHLLTSRGCEAHCLFCAVISFNRKMKLEQRWRSRSITNIVDEISELYEKFGVRCFKFVDDSFIESPRDEKWAYLFAEELKKRNLKISFRTQVRADRLSENIVSSLVQAGWFATSIGIENASESFLKRINKSATLDENKQALGLLEKYGVFTQMGMMLFDDRTIIQELETNCQFLKGCNWPVTKGIFTEVYASEGTPFSNLLEKKGKIDGKIRLGGYSYEIRDPASRSVYNSLKTWHKSHCEIYDRAIDPISAPKTIEKTGYFLYHKVCKLLMNKDLWFFGEILKMVENGSSEFLVEQFTKEAITNSEKQYKEIERELNFLDKKYGLCYEAFPNPFL